MTSVNTTSLTNQSTIKIKTHVNKQQLRPRALPKIDVHAHRHSPRKRVRTTRPHSARKNQYFEQNYFPHRRCVGLQRAVKRLEPIKPANWITPYRLRNKVLFPLWSAGVVKSWGFRVLPSRSDQSDGPVARPRGAGRRPRAVVTLRQLHPATPYQLVRTHPCSRLPNLEPKPHWHWLPSMVQRPPLYASVFRCALSKSLFTSAIVSFIIVFFVPSNIIVIYW